MMLIGYLKNEAKELRRFRKLVWTITCGYADPKKLPANELVWWPLAGDPKIRRLTQADTKRMANKFRSIKWMPNSRLKSEQK